jgi:iterative type I PKS product template protein
VLLEEPPQVPSKTKNPLSHHVVALSGRTPWSLQENTRRLLEYLMRSPNVKIADVAYTTTARRMHESLRAAYTATSTKELTSLLKADLFKTGTPERKKKPPKLGIVFAFTGQGSQYAGMGKTLYQNSTAFREMLYTYQQMATSHGLPDFTGIISGDDTDIATSSAVGVQLATVALEIATAKLLKTWGVVPGLVLGHSLGEYSALCVSGVLSVSDALFLVGKRAMLMEETLKAGEYSMLAVGKSVEMVSHVLRSDSGSRWSQTDIACINAPTVTVVSGPVSEISVLKDQLEKEDTRATVLQVPYGFHSTHVDPILHDFEAVAKGVTFSTPKIPVASTLTGEIVPIKKTDAFSPSYLTRQARESVKFVPAVEACRAAGLVADGTHWIEIGPEPVCLGLIRRTLEVSPTSLLPIFKSVDDNWATISSALASLYRAGATIDWNEYHKGFKNSLSLLDLPTYAFDVKDFWIPYVEPTLQISAAHNAKAPGNNSPSPPTVPEFSTTDLQWIEDVKVDGKSVVATFGSHTSDPPLYQAIQGHKVQGLAICSLSIFCSMAKSATQYAYSKLNPKKRVPNMTISNMEMSQALVVDEINPEQIVKTSVSYSASGNKADITFYSITSGVPAEHGSCQVIMEFDSSSCLEGRPDTLFLINARIESLRIMGQSSKAHRLLKPVIYKLFDNVVQYGREYQGLEEAWLDSEFRDAVGTVKLPDTAGKGNFQYNPFWSDTVVHLAGFLLNGNLKYPEDIACLSTGFESWRSCEDLKPDTIYTTYVTIQEVGNSSLLSGVAYVFSGSTLVMVTSGIKFQKMSKVSLSAILRSAKPSGKKGATALFKSSKTPKKSEIALIEQTIVPSVQRDSDSSSVGDIPTPDTGSSGIPTRASSINNDDDTNVIDTLLSIVAVESGYSLEDVDPSTAFADMGLDSLMAITILAKVKRDTGVELPATFFLDNVTVEDAKAALGSELGSDYIDPEPPVLIRVVEDTPAATLGDVESLPESVASIPDDSIQGPPKKTIKERLISRAILLQGSSLSLGATLFLFPDGSGSPASYIQLPALNADVSVYGMESPFIKDPSYYTCSIKEIADIFFTAIKKEKPTGPYLLGGFSFGALYAYEVARKLLENHDMVDGLLIIDMPVPKGLPSSLAPTFEELSASGFVSPRSRLTASQKIHLTHTVQAMTGYNPASCTVDNRPKRTILISAKYGLATVGKQESSELVEWVRYNSNSPSQGWQDLVGDVDLYNVDADHFALFKYPTVRAQSFSSHH